MSEQTQIYMIAKQRTVPLSEVEIPDLWTLALRLRVLGYVSEARVILKAWTLVHDFRRHIQGQLDLTPLEQLAELGNLHEKLEGTASSLQSFIEARAEEPKE
jgi:hypothetical protein